MTNKKNLQMRLLKDSWETRGECRQRANEVACARPLKKLVKAKRVKAGFYACMAICH
jgi:hypothetical protein